MATVYERRYPRNYDPFWGEGQRALAEIDNQKYMFNIQEGLLETINYSAVRAQTARSANAAIAVFSINRPGSLDAAKELVSQLKRARLAVGLDPLPIALVANRTVFGKDRLVTTEEVEALRQTGDYDIVVECFASQDDSSGITKLFLDLANLVLAQESRNLAKQEEIKPDSRKTGPNGQILGLKKRS